MVNLCVAVFFVMAFIACSEKTAVPNEKSALNEARSFLSSAGDTESITNFKHAVVSVAEDQLEEGSIEDAQAPQALYACILNPSDDNANSMYINLVVKMKEGEHGVLTIKADRGENGPENGEAVQGRLAVMEEVTFPDSEIKAKVFQSPDFVQVISNESPEEAAYLHPGFARGSIAGQTEDQPSICIDLTAVPASEE